MTFRASLLSIYNYSHSILISHICHIAPPGSVNLVSVYDGFTVPAAQAGNTGAFRCHRPRGSAEKGR